MCVKAPASAPLFAYDKKLFHTRYTLTRMLDNYVFNIGLSPADYSWHSFRRGVAMFAFDLGLDDTAVQLLGDWSSLAFKNYLEFSVKRKVAISETVAKKFDKYVKKC